MMEFSSIVTAIGTVGFPIVAFFVSVYALKYAYDRSNQQTDKAFDKLTEFSKALTNLTKAVNDNTATLQNLVERGGIDDGK